MEPVVNVTKTFDEMLAEVQFLIADGAIVFPVQDVQRCINMGLSMVHNTFHREPIDAFFTTSIGEREYKIPDTRYDGGDANVEAVWYDGEEIDPVEYEIDSGEAWTPTGYTVMGNSIVFDVTPDAELTCHVLYRREFVPLSTGETVDMSDAEINAAIFYAVYLLKLKDEEFQSANAFKGAFDDAISLASKYPAGLYSGDNGRMK